MPRRVGILGGMGPEATVLLMQRVLAAMRTDDDAGHIPLIVDQNTQVPSRIRHLIDGTGDDPGPVLADMARRLEAAGAEALAMPCNTAHHYAGAIRAAVTVPFLDMVTASVSQAAAMAAPGASVGILGSPALRRTGIYDTALRAAGLAPIYAADEDAMLAAIRSVKAQGANESAKAVLRAGSVSLFEGGASLQMIACTEFSLIAGAADPRAQVFDALDVLVSEITAFSLDPIPSRARAGS
jgi:aspartate racemase